MTKRRTKRVEESRARDKIMVTVTWNTYGDKKAMRPGILMEKISILRVMKKKTWTHHKFLHVGPKKHVEQESDTYFGLS